MQGFYSNLYIFSAFLILLLSGKLSIFKGFMRIFCYWATIK